MLVASMRQVDDLAFGPRDRAIRIRYRSIGTCRAALIGSAFMRPRGCLVNDLTPRWVVALNDEIEGREDVGEAGAGEGHGLDGAKIEGAIGPDQIKPRLAEQRRFLDSDRRLTAACGNIEPPFARLIQIETIADGEFVHPPFLLGLSGAINAVATDDDDVDPALSKVAGLAVEVAKIIRADRAVEPAIEDHKCEVLRFLVSEPPDPTVDGSNLQSGNRLAWD